jgi:hypothetical protein
MHISNFSGWDEKKPTEVKPIPKEEQLEMQHGNYERHDFRRIRFVRERSYKKMRLQKPDDNKIVVTIKVAKRDIRPTIKENGKDVENPSYNKMTYETFESIDVHESNPKEVQAAVMDGLTRAANKK